MVKNEASELVCWSTYIFRFELSYKIVEYQNLLYIDSKWTVTDLTVNLFNLLHLIVFSLNSYSLNLFKKLKIT